jgi:hypothetical protein
MYLCSCVCVCVCACARQGVTSEGLQGTARFRVCEHSASGAAHVCPVPVRACARRPPDSDLEQQLSGASLSLSPVTFCGGLRPSGISRHGPSRRHPSPSPRRPPGRRSSRRRRRGHDSEWRGGRPRPRRPGLGVPSASLAHLANAKLASPKEGRPLTSLANVVHTRRISDFAQFPRITMSTMMRDPLVLTTLMVRHANRCGLAKPPQA